MLKRQNFLMEGRLKLMMYVSMLSALWLAAVTLSVITDTEPFITELALATTLLLSALFEIAENQIERKIRKSYLEFKNMNNYFDTMSDRQTLFKDPQCSNKNNGLSAMNRMKINQNSIV